MSEEEKSEEQRQAEAAYEQHVKDSKQMMSNLADVMEKTLEGEEDISEQQSAEMMMEGLSPEMLDVNIKMAYRMIKAATQKRLGHKIHGIYLHEHENGSLQMTAYEEKKKDEDADA